MPKLDNLKQHPYVSFMMIFWLKMQGMKLGSNPGSGPHTRKNDVS